MLSFFMPSVIIKSIMLNVVMLNVVAPKPEETFWSCEIHVVEIRQVSTTCPTIKYYVLVYKILARLEPIIGVESCMVLYSGRLQPCQQMSD